MRTQAKSRMGRQEETKVNDSKLIAAFRRGERDAAEVLAERYYQKVLNTCFRYFNHGDEARDVAQEVFVKVLGERKILKFRGDAQLWTWLYRVTLNTCKTRLVQQIRLRQHGGMGGGLAHESDWEPVCACDSPEDEYAQRQAQERLHGVIQRLPKSYQDILRLIYWEECSYREAAAQLQMPTSHLGVKLMRSKSLLSKLHQTTWPEYGVN